MRGLLFGLYLMAMVAAVFLAAETVLRFVDVTPKGVFIPRFYSDVHGDLEPNMRLTDRLYPQVPYRITATPQGTRGLHAFRPEKPEGTLRVLCLGDSFTFGFGVDDEHTYPEFLQKELEVRYPGRKIEVINAGLPLFGSLDAMDYFLQKGAALKPDVVIVQFFPNDLQDLCRDRLFRESLAADPVYSRRSWVSRQLSGTKLYQFAANLRFAFGSTTYFNMPTSQEGKDLSGPNKLLDPYRFASTKEERQAVGERNRISMSEHGKELARIWDAYRKSILGLAGMIGHFKADMLFLCIPDLSQVESRAYAVNQELAPFLAGNGIASVDMLEPFRKGLFIRGIQPYLTPRDDHCSPYGNALIAGAVADRLAVVDGAAGKPAMRVVSGPGMRSLAGPLACEMIVEPGSVLSFMPGGGLSGRLVAATGVGAEKEGSFPINAIKLEDENRGQGEIELAFDSPVPLSSMEFRLPGYVGEDPAIRSSLEVLFSLDGAAWKPLLVKAGIGSGKQGTYESYYMLDEMIQDCSAKSFRLKIRLSGKSRLCSERLEGQERLRRMIVTGFPAGR